MDFNYTLRYRTFDSVLEDVSIDFNTFALENMIEPQQLIKLAKKLNYDLGLRINQTKEVVLEVCHGKVKLPDDFYVFNYALLCGEFTESVGYNGMVGGTNIQELVGQAAVRLHGLELHVEQLIVIGAHTFTLEGVST